MNPWQMRHVVTMRRRTTKRPGAVLAASFASVLACSLFFGAPTARAEDTVTLSIVMQNHQFVPAELHAPAGKPIAIHVKNENDIVSEFESGDLHFEKIVPAGSEAVVYVRPLQPGRYNFYDDFHHATQGYLIVP
jgi:uncharacterized cupredoxin-like copper-binding protein